MSIIINTERLTLKKIEKKDLKILLNHLNNFVKLNLSINSFFNLIKEANVHAE